VRTLRDDDIVGAGHFCLLECDAAQSTSRGAISQVCDCNGIVTALSC
jgi:hypothetical protein